MRKLAPLIALLATMAFPAIASAHNIAGGNAVCENGRLTVTVGLAGFNDNDKRYGVTYIILVDGRQIGDPVFTSRNDFPGKTHLETIDLPAPADANQHTVTVNVSWHTGRGTFTRTVRDCCPPKPCCTGTPGEPGPPGPAGPAGPPSTNTVIEHVVERVIVAPETCTSHRVYVFLVKRRHQIEGEPVRRILTRSLRDIRVSENGFNVTKRLVRRGKHRRFQITVRPPKTGVVAARGEVFNVTVSVRLAGHKGWISLGERYRRCAPGDGNLNAPSASGPARG